jgi:hypothetical protein
VGRYDVEAVLVHAPLYRQCNAGLEQLLALYEVLRDEFGVMVHYGATTSGVVTLPRPAASRAFLASATQRQ